MSQRAKRATKLGAALLASAVAATLSPLLAGPAGAAPAPEADISTFCAAAPNTNPFTDVSDLTPSTQDAINCIVAGGITIGTTPTTYGPTGVVNRGQMALFLTRLADLKIMLDTGAPGLTALPAGGTDAFFDDDGTAYEDALDRLNGAGVYLGVAPGEAAPEVSLSRAQMAVLVNRLEAYLVTGDADIAGSPFASAVDAFDDDNALVGEIEDSFNALGSVGIFVGDGISEVLPSNGISRAQMALVLARTAAVNFDAGLILALPGSVGGPITIPITAVQAGSSIIGSVDDPASVDSIAVSGCGLNNEPVSFGPDGSFTFLIPVSVPAETCTLTFTVRRGEDVQTQDIELTIAAAIQGVTGAPDLIGAEVDLNFDTLTYIFDEQVGNINPGGFNSFNFEVFDFTGAVSNPIIPPNPQIVGAEADRVVLQFSPGDLANATIASLAADVIRDSGGISNYAAGVPITNATFQANRTNAPDLVSATFVPPTDANGNELIQLTFDEPVGQVNDPSLMRLVREDSTFIDLPFVQQVPYPTFNVIGTVVTLNLDSNLLADLDPIEWRQIHIFPSAVEDPQGNINSFDSVDIAGGITDRPDLLSATIVGSDEVLFVFDEQVGAVQNVTPDPSNFALVRPNANLPVIPGTLAVRAVGDPAAVRVTFPPGTVGSTIRAVALFEAVIDNFGPNIGQPNRVDTVPLEGLAFQAGRTELADLVSVTKVTNPFGEIVFTLTFDEALPAGNNGGDYAFAIRLISNAGFDVGSPGGGGMSQPTPTTLSFTTPTGGLTRADGEAAVVLSFDGQTLPNPLPVFSDVINVP